MKLNKEKAVCAIREKIAEPLGMDVFQAAAGICEISSSKMADLIRKVTVDKGYDPRDFVLLVYGGAGAQYAASYGAEAGVKRVIVPYAAAGFSAFGAATSDIVANRSLSLPMLVPPEVKKLNEIYYGLNRKVVDDLRRNGVSDSEMVLIQSVDIRFRRQVHEVNIPVPGGELNAESIQWIVQSFETKYENLYGKDTAYKAAGMEMVSYRVTGIGKTKKPASLKYSLHDPNPSSAKKGTRDAFFKPNGGFVATNVYDIEKLKPGNLVNGPAIVETPLTTIVIQPGQRGLVDEYLNVVIEPRTIEKSFPEVRTRRKALDPVTFEILRHRLWSIVDEAASTIKRMSGSPVATEAGDFNVGLLDALGNQLLVGLYITGHAATQDLVVRHILAEYEDNPGIGKEDMFICSDPYIGALHQSDIVCLAPIHWRNRLVAWSGCTIHQIDVGGPTFGGFAVGAKSIFEEPPPIPPLKIVEKGRLRKDIQREFLIRSRVPELVALDLRAQIGANNVVKTRVHQLIERYGVNTLAAVMNKMVKHVETRVKARLKELPDGTWRHQTFIEHDGLENKIYGCRLTMTKTDDNLVLDYTESDEQAPGLINASCGGLRGGVMSSILPLLGYDIPWTPEGFWKAIKLVTKRGTILDANWPAGMSGSPVSAMRAVTVLTHVCIAKMFEASEKYRDRAMASWRGSGSILNLTGTNQRGERFGTMLLDAMASGTGARSYKDGIESGGSITSIASSTANVEYIEYLFPLLYLYRHHQEDSGGPGKFRGGVSGVSSFTLYNSPGPIDVILFSYGCEQPTGAGIAGGYPGGTSEFVVMKRSNVSQLLNTGKVVETIEQLNGELEVWPAMKVTRLDRGDVLLWNYASGGGYGDPLQRDPQLVLKDVAQKLVSTQCSSEIYGVVFTPNFAVDIERTQQQRAKLRQERSEQGSKVGPVTGSSYEHVALSIGENLTCNRRGDSLLTCCKVCGAVIGPVTENYKLRTSVAEYPITRAGLAVIPYTKESRFVLREFYCPGCFTLFDVEINVRDAPFVWDVQLASLI
jgi:N-methylhydantoinase B